MKTQFARLVAFFSLALTASQASAEDWGFYSIIPVSAPLMVLEAVEFGTTEGTVVSIGRPTAAVNQKWVVLPKGDNFYSIKPSYSSTLVLAVDKGGEQNGAQVVLETESDKPWQLWTLTQQENGSYTLVPKHARTQGLDHFGGKKEPGAKIDLWEHKPGDQHLQWYIRPLAGSPIPAAVAADAAPAYVPPVLKPEELLSGEITQFKFNTSKIFPGTVRDVTVFIPAQYDGSKPACVYVKTDGFTPWTEVNGTKL